MTTSRHDDPSLTTTWFPESGEPGHVVRRRYRRAEDAPLSQERDGRVALGVGAAPSMSTEEVVQELMEGEHDEVLMSFDGQYSLLC